MNDDRAFVGLGTLGAGGCCCLLLLAGMAFVIVMLIKRKKNSAANPPPPASSQPKATLTSTPPGAKQVGAIVTNSGPLPNTVGRFAQYGNLISNVADDGFYLSNQFLVPGSIVHYRFRQGGSWVERSVPYQPGPQGHFVFVGNNPTDIQVFNVIPPGGAQIVEDPMRTMITPSPMQTKAPPPRPTSSYPTAY